MDFSHIAWSTTSKLLAGIALAALAWLLSPAVKAETLASFDAKLGQLSEGVAVDADGNVFASLSPRGEVVKIAANTHQLEPFAVVTGIGPGEYGLLGITVDRAGNVYGAVSSANQAARGVWRFDRTTGAAERIKGSAAIALPDSVAFDPHGVLYVTDAVLGAVWRVMPGSTAQKWIVDPLLAGNRRLRQSTPFGANGIAWHDHKVIVGVTETSRVISIGVKHDGSAGKATVFAELPGVVIDGVAVDSGGTVYVCDPLANRIVAVAADGTVETVASVADGLDRPTSLVFGPGADGPATLYVANFSIGLGRRVGAGPSIMTIGVK